MNTLLLGVILFETASAIVLAGALASRAYAPASMHEDGPPNYAHERELAPPSHHLDAHAEPSRYVPPAEGVCDAYETGDDSPCWCWGIYNMPSMKRYYGNEHFCDNAETYIESVQAYGPPKGGAYVVFR